MTMIIDGVLPLYFSCFNFDYIIFLFLSLDYILMLKITILLLNELGTMNITSARIKIFQRSATVMLRKFTNLNDVVKLAQSYTTIPVEVITINETSSIQEQIRLFNSFDVLITSHGSHLANGLFTMEPERKAVIEVVSFVFDSVFYGNFNHWLGFADYMMSSGHLTPGAPANGRSFYFGDLCPFQKREDFDHYNCSDNHLSLTDSKLTQYPNKLPQTWKICNEHFQTRACDTLVDLDILKKHLDQLFSSRLCRPGPEDARRSPSDMKLAAGVMSDFEQSMTSKGKEEATHFADTPSEDNIDPGEFH